MNLPPVLTIAGSDSSGGAGIQADLKTFTALGVYGMSALTALTAQNTLHVTRVLLLPPDFLQAQLEAIWEDIPPVVVKTGMLGSSALIQTVRAFLRERAAGIPWVVDPVLVATSGARLLEEAAQGELLELCAEATVVTPNLPEAAALAHRPEPSSEEEAFSLGRELSTHYPHPYWLLKGGHASWEKHTLTSWVFKGGRLVQRFVQNRLPLPRPPHGTGCTLASAIAAYIARGEAPLVAIGAALDFVHRALAAAPPLGKGALLLNPLTASLAPTAPPHARA
uniref:hydroxymethylpyrimidine kinase n=1 Tax=uncultured Bacteroidota bacterium TaxID=152509 RepID=H5SGK8_9BACT|nr:hypothetical conserved protein [uncultured Bacteroidetes bacterium]